MSVSLVGRRTVGALLAEIEVLMKGGRIGRADEIRVDKNEGGFCLSRVDGVSMEGDGEKLRTMILTLQSDDDDTL